MRGPRVDRFGLAENVIGPAELRKLQLRELRVLDDFARLCDEHGLQYYLVFGTLLGAMRHEGFIPWDDDLDVAMPREDYRRFAQLISANLDDRYRLQSQDLDAAWPYRFSKLSLRGTRIEVVAGAEESFGRGIGLDIFPLDGVPESRGGRMLRRVVVRLMNMSLSSRRSVRRRRRRMRWVAFWFRLIPPALISSVFGWTTRRWRTTDCGTWFCPGPYRSMDFPSDWFGDGEQFKFEGLMLNGPVRADDYLTSIYGDYMTPLPPEQRLGHGILTVDFGGPAVEEDLGEVERSLAPLRLMAPSAGSFEPE